MTLEARWPGAAAAAKAGRGLGCGRGPGSDAFDDVDREVGMARSGSQSKDFLGDRRASGSVAALLNLRTRSLTLIWGGYNSHAPSKTISTSPT